MEYIIISIGAIIFLMVQARLQDQKRKRALIYRIMNEWGEVPQREYTSEDFLGIRKYYDSIQESDQDIDEITFQDLDMKEIYMLLNNTGSSIGEEVLYAMLRKPITSDEELKKRNRWIQYFDSNEEERIKLQTIFANIGKVRRLSIYEYINSKGPIEESSPLLDILQALGLVASIIMIGKSPMIGGLLVTAFIAVNLITYYKRKAKIESYLTVFSYILKILDGVEEIKRLRNPKVKEDIFEFYEIKRAFQKFRRGSFLVLGGNSMSGDLGDLILDYIRILFHIDIIKFNSMLRVMRKNTDILQAVYEKIGYLESMIAAASFRNLLEYYSEPKLSLSDKPYMNTTEVYHPLIDDPIPNTINLRKSSIVTGSNASGKSTFLKTLAINAILAQTIYTSLSTHYQASYFRIFSSMALKDNIFQKESYYIVEIKSLKRILNHMNQEIPVLCFVDEVLRGTNTLERIAASSQILYTLSQGNTLCLAATHDIELTYILENYFSNYHFLEKIENDDILFDYKIHDGRAVSKNAIKLLDMMGYSADIIENATNLANGFLETGKWTVLNI